MLASSSASESAGAMLLDSASVVIAPAAMRALR